MLCHRFERFRSRLIPLTIAVFALTIGCNGGTGEEDPVPEPPPELAWEDCNRNGIDDALDLRPSGFDYETERLFEVGAAPTALVRMRYPGNYPALAVVNSAAPRSISIITAADVVRAVTGTSDPVASVSISLPSDRVPICLAADDFDGDGDMDLAVGSNLLETPSSSRVTLIWNDGDGGFEPIDSANDVYRVGIAHHNAQGHQCVAAADFDGDGYIDLAMTTGDTDEHRMVSLLKNRGDGDFGERRDIPIELYNPAGISAADLNSSASFDGGGLDFVVGSENDSRVAVLLTNGDPFTDLYEPHYYTTGANPLSVATGDFDMDGDTDFAVANHSDDGRVKVFIRQEGFSGDLHSATYEVGHWPRSITVGDLDRDGDLDIAVGNNKEAGEDDLVSVLVNEASDLVEERRRRLRDSEFSTPVLEYPVNSGPYAIAAVSMYSDAFLDLATANLDTGNVSILINASDEPFDRDCQPNGVLDACDIRSGVSEDLNGNWIPDECPLD